MLYTVAITDLEEKHDYVFFSSHSFLKFVFGRIDVIEEYYILSKQTLQHKWVSVLNSGVLRLIFRE